MVLGLPLTRNTSISNGTSTDFDLWLRMATDNKINAKNSWNFALIDYFQDLSMLRDGEGINFQRASVTLDGCVKIYSSRVDSAATETGKLLSGLSAQTKIEGNRLGLDAVRREGETDDEEEYDSDDSEYGRSNNNKKKKKVTFARNIPVDSTLLTSFQSLRAKKVESELAVDPVFRKALADFDEGGAKSLLLNMLNVDSKGRVMFDSERQETTNHHKSGTSDASRTDNTSHIDIATLGRRFIPEDLSKYLVCPSMEEIQNLSKSLTGSTLLDKVNDNFEDDKNDIYANSGSIFYDDNDENDPESYPERSINMTLQRLFNDSGIDSEAERGDVFETTEVLDYELMSYFDNEMQRFWKPRKEQAQSEHWKIRNLKSRNQYQVVPRIKHNKATTMDKKVAHTIDFINDEDIDEDELFAESNTTTFLPKNQWSSNRRTSGTPSGHTLPKNFQLESRRLISLFIKPEVNLPTFNKKRKSFRFGNDGASSQPLTDKVDEQFLSQKYKEDDRLNEILKEDLHELHQSYDQSFFQDEEEFTDHTGLDLHEDINPMGDNVDNIGGYGSQLITARNLFKPTYRNFSKVAKRVDVKLLKENLWDCLNIDNSLDKKNEHTDNPSSEAADSTTEYTIEQNFSETIGRLNSKYTPDQFSNLSTSFCFICILHLANEHGLELTNNEEYTDLIIQGSSTA